MWLENITGGANMDWLWILLILAGVFALVWVFRKKVGLFKYAEIAEGLLKFVSEVVVSLSEVFPGIKKYIPQIKLVYESVKYVNTIKSELAQVHADKWEDKAYRKEIYKTVVKERTQELCVKFNLAYPAVMDNIIDLVIPIAVSILDKE